MFVILKGSAIYNLFIFLLLLMFGCSFIPSSDSQKIEETDVSIRAPLDGIWTGQFDIRGRGPYDFTTVHLNDKTYAYSLKAKAMCIGTLTFDGEHSFHKYVLFALDGGPFDWANITGTLSTDEQQQKTLNSHFKTLNGGDTGALSIAYSKIYEQASALEDLQGKWTYTDKDDLTTNVTIDEKGTLQGDDTDGCAYLGYVDIINPQYNVYSIKVEISNCGSVAGEYEGVSFVRDGAFTTQIANPRYALYYSFDRN